MGEAVLVNRKKFVSSLANELVEPFNELSKKTRINKSHQRIKWNKVELRNPIIRNTDCCHTHLLCIIFLVSH